MSALKDIFSGGGLRGGVFVDVVSQESDKAFNPDQPRDESGRWASGSGGGSLVAEPMYPETVVEHGSGASFVQDWHEGLLNLPEVREVIHNASLAPTPDVEAAASNYGMAQPHLCMVESGRFMVRYNGDRQPALVHGVYDPQGRGEEYFHAWVDMGDNRIFDGATQMLFDKQAYLYGMNAVEQVRYPQQEVAAKLVEEGNWGPWHDAEIPSGDEKYGGGFEPAALNEYTPEGENPDPWSFRSAGDAEPKKKMPVEAHYLNVPVDAEMLAQAQQLMDNHNDQDNSSEAQD